MLRHLNAVLGADKVTYLGNVVSAADIPIDTKKIKTVSSLEQPVYVEQGRSYLEQAGYYRNFIPNFATSSAPFVQSTKKSQNYCGPLHRGILYFNSSPYFEVPPFSHISSVTPIVGWVCLYSGR